MKRALDDQARAGSGPKETCDVLALQVLSGAGSELAERLVNIENDHALANALEEKQTREKKDKQRADEEKKKKKKDKKAKKEKKPKKHTKKQCAICTSRKSDRKFSRLTVGCTHEARCCSRCVRRHIETEVNSKGNLSVKCPECRKELAHAAVQAHASGKVFQQFDKLLLRKTVSSLPNFRWCKNATCGSGQEHASGDTAPIMRCHACQSRSCFTHDVPWHEGMTCADYNDRLSRDRNEMANDEYKRRKTKPCPKCTASIEKRGGCDHMTCEESAGGCGHEFCWLCLADYGPIMHNGNHYHKRTCTYWSNYASDSENEAEDEDVDEAEAEVDDDDVDGDLEEARMRRSRERRRVGWLGRGS